MDEEAEGSVPYRAQALTSSPVKERAPPLAGLFLYYSIIFSGRRLLPEIGGVGPFISLNIDESPPFLSLTALSLVPVELRGWPFHP